MKDLDISELLFDGNFFKNGKLLPLEDWQIKPLNDLTQMETLMRNSEIVTCPKCGVKGNSPNMARWHFDNCKTITKSCKQCGKIIPRTSNDGTNIKPYLYNQKNYCNRKCYMESKKGIPPIIMTEEVKKKISMNMRRNSNARKSNSHKG